MRAPTLLLFFVITLGAACRDSAPPAAPKTANQPSQTGTQTTSRPPLKAENVVNVPISAELQAKAAKEITAENVDEFADKLEAQIEAETP